MAENGHYPTEYGQPVTIIKKGHVDQNGEKKSHLVRNGQGPIKPTMASYASLNLQLKRMSEQGKTVYNMAIGQSPFPVIEVAAEQLRQYCHEGEYVPAVGLAELRSTVCEFHRDYDQVDYQPDDVVVGPGSKLLIDLLISVFDGDILVESPSWPSYSAQCSRSGRPITVLDSSYHQDWMLEPDTLEQHLSSRWRDKPVMLLLCSPNNPAGYVYSESQLKRLCCVLKKYDVIVMSDEIYARLYPNHISIAKFYPEMTILSSGLSKWAAVGGWRIGYHMYPPRLHYLRDAVIGVGTHTYSCCPTPVQMAITKTLQCKAAVTEYLYHVRRILDACVEFTVRELKSVDVRMSSASSGYFALADFECIRPSLHRRGVDTGHEMCQLILQETGIGFVAGSSFYRPRSELSARLVLVCFDGSAALNASRNTQQDLTENFVEKHCSHLYQAVKALKDWVIAQRSVAA